MDVEAPPPFTAGSLEEPPDPHDSVRLAVFDEDDGEAQTMHIPTGIPTLELDDFGKENGLPGRTTCDRVVKKNTETHSSKCFNETNNSHSNNSESVHEPTEESVSDIDEVPSTSNEVDCSQNLADDDSISEPKVEEISVADDFDDFAEFSSSVSNTNSLDPPKESVDGNVTEVECSVTTMPPESLTPQEKAESEDEWGDFDSAPMTSSHQIEEKIEVDYSKTVDIDNDDCEWGAFDSAPRINNSDDSAQSDADWGAFGQAEKSTSPENDDSNWAADFSSAPASVEEVDPQTSFDVPILEDLLESDELWNFEEDIDSTDDEIIHLHEVMDREDPTDLYADHILFSSAVLWKALRVVEETHALKYQWKSAKINQKMLKELNIDPEAVNRGSLPPLSTNAVLTPTPVANGSTKRTVVMAPNGDSATVSSSAPTDASPVEEKVVVENSSFNSLMVPPADFDWDKSGLTNPLKLASRSSALLDIDFLSANSGGAASALSTLQKDLAELGISSIEKTMTKPASQPSMLDTLMSSAAAQQKKYRAPSELSLDARALHDQLPDIDYLRAKMIMFPIGNSRNGNGQ